MAIVSEASVMGIRLLSSTDLVARVVVSMGRRCVLVSVKCDKVISVIMSLMHV